MAVRPYALWRLSSVIPTYVLVFSVLIFISEVYSDSLYSADDPLWELDSTNFNRIVLGKNNAWVVEFYNYWCGHCVRFAPTWQAFAKDIQTWKNIIEVAVVNCASSDNIKLCREYDVNSFPSIKLFWTNVDEEDKGKDFTGDRDLQGLRHNVIKFLESEWGSGVAANWPQLDPLQIDNVEEMWSTLPERVDTASIIIEQPESYVGREVILDLSFMKHKVVRRVSSRNRKFVRKLLMNEPTNSTVLLKAERNGKVIVQKRFPMNSNETYIRNQIFEILAGFPRDSQPENELIEISSGPKEFLPKGVYLRDLENAVSYALTREIGVHSNLTVEKLDALKAYVYALKMYLPGSPPLMGYLSKVNNWIFHRKESLTGEKFLDQLDQFKTDKEYLPEIKDWIECRGSQNRYRGYPCSLWMLFHTLTVQAYTMHEENPSSKDPHKVLFAIHGYVKNFFTCKECSKHFQAMAANLESELHHPEDAVLWLWKAHNQVNRRVSGDSSEDPHHKKIQFPPVELCQRCQTGKSGDNNDIQWDNDEVLRFLKRFYGQKNIIVSPEEETSLNGNDITRSFPSGRFNDLQDNKGVSIGGHSSKTASLLLITFLLWLIF